MYHVIYLVIHYIVWGGWALRESLTLYYQSATPFNIIYFHCTTDIICTGILMFINTTWLDLTTTCIFRQAWRQSATYLTILTSESAMTMWHHKQPFETSVFSWTLMSACCLSSHGLSHSSLASWDSHVLYMHGAQCHSLSFSLLLQHWG